MVTCASPLFGLRGSTSDLYSGIDIDTHTSQVSIFNLHGKTWGQCSCDRPSSSLGKSHFEDYILHLRFFC